MIAMATDKSKLTAAFKRMRTFGILARQNFMCCQTCGCAKVDLIVDEKRAKKKEVPLGYCFYHAQDADTLRLTGKVFLAYGAIDNSGDSTAVGHIICECLRQCGLEFQWEGSRWTRIEVTVWKGDE
jgi:hypothetical protein